MKLLSYVFVMIFPFMCSAPHDNGDAYTTESDIRYESEIVAETPLPPQTAAYPVSQKLIKTAYLKFETKNLDTTYRKLIKAVKAHKGFIQDDNSNKAYHKITRHLILRVPTHHFQNTIDAIAKDVSYFDTKHISAKDVTEEFIDLEARLKAKRTLETRYLELLQKAKNVKEILDIERELSKIREDIEAKQGRLNYLQNRVKLSTVDIEFYTLTSSAPVATSYGTKMWNAIKGGVEGISIFILGLLYIWPLLIFIIISIFLLKRWLKKRNNKIKI